MCGIHYNLVQPEEHERGGISFPNLNQGSWDPGAKDSLHIMTCFPALSWVRVWFLVSGPVPGLDPMAKPTDRHDACLTPLFGTRHRSTSSSAVMLGSEISHVSPKQRHVKSRGSGFCFYAIPENPGLAGARRAWGCGLISKTQQSGYIVIGTGMQNERVLLHAMPGQCPTATSRTAGHTVCTKAVVTRPGAWWWRDEDRPLCKAIADSFDIHHTRLPPPPTSFPRSMYACETDPWPAQNLGMNCRARGGEEKNPIDFVNCHRTT